MDQYPAQTFDNQEGVSGGEPPVELPSSPFKKFIPFIIIAVFLLIILSGLMLLSAGNNKTKKDVIPTPTPRPTATPFPAPTIPEVTQPVASISATLTPAQKKVGRMAFIRDGDVYHSDLATVSLLTKNATSAGDRLSWSSKGNFLAWRSKTTTATPSALVVYNLSKNTKFAIKPNASDSGELIDYAWSFDETKLALLFSDDSSYNISFYSTSTSSSELNSFSRSTFIKQLLWLENNNLLFSGIEGISILNPVNSTVTLLVPNKNILKMKLSPDGKKLLYSVGDNKKSDLYLLNIESRNNESIAPVPPKINMGTTGLPATTLNNGFIPYALFMPDGNSLIVGYHYLPNLPLVGIYNLKENSFSAITTFALYDTDVMVDEWRLLGARVNTVSGVPTWQIALFTTEDNAKLSLIRVIPDASSPTFFGKGLD